MGSVGFPTPEWAERGYLGGGSLCDFYEWGAREGLGRQGRGFPYSDSLHRVIRDTAGGRLCVSPEWSIAGRSFPASASPRKQYGDGKRKDSEKGLHLSAPAVRRGGPA